MPIIGPIPKTKSTNFAEFFVWPNFWSLKFELVWFFFDFFFFIKDILIQHDFRRFWYVIGFDFWNFLNLIPNIMKNKLYDNADSFAMSFDEEWVNIDCIKDNL